MDPRLSDTHDGAHIASEIALFQDERGRRLRLTQDTRIPTIAAKEFSNLTLLDHCKRFTGHIVICQILDASGHIQRVGINVASLAKQLGISKQSASRIISSAGGIGKLSSLATSLTKSIDKSQNLTPRSTSTGVSHEVSSISSHSTESHLPTTTSSESPRITSDQVKQKFSEITHRLIGALTDAHTDITHYQKEFSIHAERYQISKSGDQLDFLRLGQKLGSGHFGDVLAAEDILNPHATVIHGESVIKVAKHVDDTTIENEHLILNEINPQGLHEGLQLPSRRLVQLKIGLESRSGYLGPRYTGTLKNYSYSNLPHLRSIFKQLCRGVNQLHTAGWYHGDIKPVNMLHRPDRYDLADLGGAQRMQAIHSKLTSFFTKTKTLQETKKALWGVHTTDYINASDIKCLEWILLQAARKYDRSGESEDAKARIVEETQQKIVYLMRARDSYALGISMYNIIYPMGDYLTKLQTCLDNIPLNPTLEQVLSTLSPGLSASHRDKLQRYLDEKSHERATIGLSSMLSKDELVSFVHKLMAEGYSEQLHAHIASLSPDSSSKQLFYLMEQSLSGDPSNMENHFKLLQFRLDAIESLQYEPHTTGLVIDNFSTLQKSLSQVSHSLETLHRNGGFHTRIEASALLQKADGSLVLAATAKEHSSKKIFSDLDTLLRGEAPLIEFIDNYLGPPSSDPDQTYERAYLQDLLSNMLVKYQAGYQTASDRRVLLEQTSATITTLMQARDAKAMGISLLEEILPSYSNTAAYWSSLQAHLTALSHSPRQAGILCEKFQCMVSGAAAADQYEQFLQVRLAACHQASFLTRLEDTSPGSFTSIREICLHVGVDLTNMHNEGYYHGDPSIGNILTDQQRFTLDINRLHGRKKITRSTIDLRAIGEGTLSINRAAHTLLSEIERSPPLGDSKFLIISLEKMRHQYSLATTESAKSDIVVQMRSQLHSIMQAHDIQKFAKTILSAFAPDLSFKPEPTYWNAIEQRLLRGGAPPTLAKRMSHLLQQATAESSVADRSGYLSTLGDRFGAFDELILELSNSLTDPSATQIAPTREAWV